ncbi:hypothetical protein GALMADRAFT_1163286 [Galerina marginata CBS 339.88]|uniref:Uncharacterized protein n=1 Tax=Galerina marginata (strain CBS 339.88) TaxID=685588 RepID=A0A067TBN8_GALM3|nr:hypothetical protein GALMADRAFT_1163286 [Galerina marginata CBS 339.88]
MNILPHMYVDLEWEYNRSFFSPSIQSAMDDFGFIAVTASSSTLDQLIPMIKSENIRRQAEVNKYGSAELRKIDYSHPVVNKVTFTISLVHTKVTLSHFWLGK